MSDTAFEAEVGRQIEIAVGYSPDPENVQAHLDSWADRYARVRVRLVGVEDEPDVLRTTLALEMICVEPKPLAPVKRRSAQWSDFIATWLLVAAISGGIVIGLGVCVRVARLIGWGV